MGFHFLLFLRFRSAACELSLNCCRTNRQIFKYKFSYCTSESSEFWIFRDLLVNKRDSIECVRAGFFFLLFRFRVFFSLVEYVNFYNFLKTTWFSIYLILDSRHSSVFELRRENWQADLLIEIIYSLFCFFFIFSLYNGKIQMNCHFWSKKKRYIFILFELFRSGNQIYRFI